MPPKVSICVPAYNRRAMFRTTLWSVLHQTYQNFEVIVSDNASEDDILAEVKATMDPRVKFFRQKKNIGVSANFQFLQTLPRGEYVLFLCSDDLLLPDCLAKAVEVLDLHAHRGGVVYMAAHYKDNEGFQFLSSMPNRTFAATAEYESDRSVRDFRFAAPSLCLYRRNVLERLGGWHPDLVAVFDWDLFARVTRYGGGIVFLHEVLAIMRLHGDRVSNTTALHWGFFHDVMLLSGQAEYQWGSAYRAMALVEQLLWDWRLRISPRKTLAHAHTCKAFPGVLLYLPWEILRRFGLKLRFIFGRRPQAHVAASIPSELPGNCDPGALDRFWRASETVRLG